MPQTVSDEDFHGFLVELEKIIISRKNADPEKSYTAKLLQGNINGILQKVGEESIEYILEAKSNNKERAIAEGADLFFHFLVSLQGINLSLNDILGELYKRHNK